MSVSFTEYNGKQWIFFVGKYVFSNNDPEMLISNDTEKILEDCIKSCSMKDNCQWFSWSTVGGECRQYKFIENNDSVFQWRYDFYKYPGKELQAFNLEHYQENQERCINDCYNDTNCVGVNYISKTKACRIFYNYSDENTYFGYYSVTQNETPVGQDPTTIGNNIYKTEAKIESTFSFGKFITILFAIILFAIGVILFWKYKKSDEKKKLPPLPPKN